MEHQRFIYEHQISISEILSRKKKVKELHNEIPDNVMIHSSQRAGLEVEAMTRYSNPENLKAVFGMLIIWTDAINATDIVCTKNYI